MEAAATGANKPPPKDSETKNILNAIDYKNLGNYFGNPVIITILYFIILISFIVVLFSTTYVTISSLITIFFVYLLIKQIYYALNDKSGKAASLWSFALPIFLIIFTLACNAFLPKSSKFVLTNQSNIIQNIQMPIYSILYASIIYGIFFIFMLIYHTFDKNKITLLCVSFFFIILSSMYIVTRSNLPQDVTKSQTTSMMINTLVYTPLVASCIYIIYVFMTYKGFILSGYNDIKNTSLMNNITRVIPTPAASTITNMEEQLNNLKQYDTSGSKSSSKTESFMPGQVAVAKDLSIYGLLIIYGIVFLGCFFTFLNTTANTKYNSLNELVIILINGFIISVIAVLTMKMTSAGFSSFQNDSIKELNKSMKTAEIKRGQYFGRLGLENEEYGVLALLIVYNVAIANVFNNDYFSKDNEIFVKFLSSFIPSSYITKYENSLPTLSIIITYIITFAIYYKVIMKERNVKNDSDLLMFFITLILFITVILYINGSKLAQGSSLNNGISPYIYAIIAFVIIFCVGLFLIYISTKLNMNLAFFNMEKDQLMQSITVSLFILFGIFFLFSLINWIIQLFQVFTFKNSDGSSSVFGIILNFAIIITLLAIIYRMMSYSNLFKGSTFITDSPLSQLIIGCIFYIPCLLIALIDILSGYYKKGSTVMVNAMKRASTGDLASSVSSLQITPSRTDIILLILIVLLYLIYYSIPYTYTLFSSQGGQLLLKEPVYTDKEIVLATYTSLNPQVNSTKKSFKLFNYDFSWSNPDYNATQVITHSYNYALSCWIFIDANSTANNRGDTFHSLINYGGKPNVQYRGNDNQMIITIEKMDVSGNPTLYEGKKYDLDDDGNFIVYRNKNVLLQKWNNIVINYNSGILDIFINGKLQQSFNGGSIPYMKLDNITIGEKNGLHGGICNVVYFSDALNIKQVYYLYTSVKDLNPPILMNYYDSLYLSSIKVENATEKIGLNQIAN